MDAEKKCWLAAVEVSRPANPALDSCDESRAQLHNATLKPGSKKRIDQNHVSTEQYVKDLSTLAHSTHNLYNKPDEGCGSALSKLQSVIQAVHRFAPVVDTFVQNQPHITALVWGSIRFLIQVSLRDAHLSACSTFN
jgi:hypothetical protein